MGIPIRYGQAEKWKTVRKIIGRTKPSRAHDIATKKRKRNDGRAPDTSKEILLSERPNKRHKNTNDGRPPDTIKALRLRKTWKQATTKKSVKRRAKKKAESIPSLTSTEESSSSSDSDHTVPYALTESSDSDRVEDDKEDERVTSPSADPSQPLACQVFGPQSYAWAQNSCWLDTSMQLLYIALSTTGGLDEFSELCQNLPKHSAILVLHEALNSRRDLMRLPTILSAQDVVQQLRFQRQKLRSELQRRRITQGPLNSYQSLWVRHYCLAQVRIGHLLCYRFTWQRLFVSMT